jgi:ribosomal protein S18 acetylase RimI-like enzyme
MAVELREASISALDAHAAVPIGFTVDSVLDVVQIDGGVGGIELVERRLDQTYVKDYDADEHSGAAGWATRFDLTNWGLILASSDDEPVGGAVIAWDCPELYMLTGSHHAALWDLRVAPDARRRGVGAMLFTAVEEWSRARDCTLLTIETQNVNVRACRFYAAMGCTLGAMNRHAYTEHPEEVQLIWSKSLATS